MRTKVIENSTSFALDVILPAIFSMALQRRSCNDYHGQKKKELCHRYYTKKDSLKPNKNLKQDVEIKSIKQGQGHWQEKGKGSNRFLLRCILAEML